MTQKFRAGVAPLRILIDLRWMIPGQSGGLEDVAYCFLDQLLPWQNGDALTLIVPYELIDRFRAVVPIERRWFPARNRASPPSTRRLPRTTGG